MYLSGQNFDFNIVEEVKSTYMNKTTINEKIKIKNSDINTNIKDKMNSSFHYLHKYTKDKRGNPIEPYTSQIYAVYQTILHLGKTDNNGVILQVQTGEGKSYIIQALAEHLARQGNIVHIATSNIILVARDYFKRCESKKNKVLSSKIQYPSILIHQDELKFIKKFLNEDENVKNDKEMKSVFYSKKML